MRKNIIEYELTDGTTGTVRILAADKVGMEKTVRINGWPLEDGPRTATLMLFYAMRREARTTAENYDAFVNHELADYALFEPAEDMDEDPKAD